MSESLRDAEDLALGALQNIGKPPRGLSVADPMRRDTGGFHRLFRE